MNIASIYTPLVRAVKKKKLKVLQALIDAGANVEAALGNRYLLSEGRNVLRTFSGWKEAPLGEQMKKLIAEGDIGGVRQLLGQKVDREMKVEGADTALMYALRVNQAEIAQILVSAGWSAVEVAANAATTGPMKKVLAQILSSDPSPIQKCINDGNVEGLKALFRVGLDIETKIEGNSTALVYALNQSLEGIAAALIDLGASAEKALTDPALSFGGNRKLQTIIEAKKPKESIPRSRIAIIVKERIEANDVETVRSLVREGLDCTVLIEGKFTALVYAAKQSKGEIVRVLIENGFDSDAALRDPNLYYSEKTLI
jgi:ankyrin repeat protein